MGIIKGSREYDKFKKGEKLSRKASMLAKCYECNGYVESNADCGISACPLYPYHPHRTGEGQF